MKPFQAVLKHLFGERYRGIIRSLVVSVILYLSLTSSGISLRIHPRFLSLTALAFSGSVMAEVLFSSKSQELFRSLFALPFRKREMTASLTCAYTLYTILTRTLPALAIFFALDEVPFSRAALAFLLALTACQAMAAWFTLASYCLRQGKKGSDIKRGAVPKIILILISGLGRLFLPPSIWKDQALPSCPEQALFCPFLFCSRA
ncbi:MAG: hypothetical protein IIZ39_07355 [Blautia sp.]|nr:hypothetical protein [Blautia sp.]